MIKQIENQQLKEDDDEYIEELERLAEIGRATQKAFEKGIFIHDIVYSHEGELVEYKSESEIEDFIHWAKEDE